MQSNGTPHICTFSLSASNSGKVSLHIFSGFRFLILQLATFQSQIDWKKEIYFSGNKDFGTHIPLLRQLAASLHSLRLFANGFDLNLEISIHNSGLV